MSAYPDPRAVGERPPSARKTLAALERAFSAEIEGRLPFCSKAKIYRQLCDEGLLQPMQRVFGGQFPVTVTGFQLTHAGRLTYCMSCDDEEATNDATV